jgi:type III restriction enzyme
MNDDYLWDKSGEPDPQIQQLEEILGTLRYQPRPLNLPRRRNYLALLAIAATVVMALLLTWAFCNHAKNPQSEIFPGAALIVAPNLTVRERLEVLRPELGDKSYFREFDIVPTHLWKAFSVGKVVVLNWHKFAPEPNNYEGGQGYRVVNKPDETPEDFARRVLGDLHGKLPIMVLNDEGHHCWRPAPAPPA